MLAVFIILVAAAFIVDLLYEVGKEANLPHARDVVGQLSYVSFFCLAAILLASLVYLIVQIRITVGDELLKSEERTVIVLASIFSGVYILRAVYNIWYGRYYEIVCSRYIRFIITDTLPVLWDLPPICSILVLHHMNFKTNRKPPR